MRCAKKKANDKRGLIYLFLLTNKRNAYISNVFNKKPEYMHMIRFCVCLYIYYVENSFIIIK